MTPEQADRLLQKMIDTWRADTDTPDLGPFRRRLLHASYVSAAKAIEVLRRRPYWPTVDELDTAIAQGMGPETPRPSFPRVVPPVHTRPTLTRKEHAAWAARVRAELTERSPGSTSTTEEAPLTEPSSPGQG